MKLSYLIPCGLSDPNAELTARLAGAGYFGMYGVLRASLRSVGGTYRLPDLVTSVAGEFADDGIPSVSANSREEAFRALGFVNTATACFKWMC